jgi:hypothetical protein
MNTVTTSGRLLVSPTASVAPISGSAGSMMSIDIAVIDINRAISAMNSRNGNGKRVAVSSGMWMSGRFKRDDRRAGEFPCSAPGGRKCQRRLALVGDCRAARTFQKLCARRAESQGQIVSTAGINMVPFWPVRVLSSHIPVSKRSTIHSSSGSISNARAVQRQKSFIDVACMSSRNIKWRRSSLRAGKRRLKQERE